MNEPLFTLLSEASAGMPGDDAADILLVQSQWLRARAREMCGRGTYPLRIRIGTFNVNGKAPTEEIATWIRGTSSEGTADRASYPLPPVDRISPISLEDVARDVFSINSSLSSTSTVSGLATTTDRAFAENVTPDMLVLGFQELDLSTEALIYSTGSAKEDAWCSAVFEVLGPQAILYEKLASKQLVGMLIIIIVKKALRSAFSDIRVCAAGAGIMGVMGNKGGTAIRLKFTPPALAPTDADGRTAPSDEAKPHARHASVLTFVNAHLAAFDEMVERRNADFHDLSRRLGFATDPRLNTGITGGSNGANGANSGITPMISVYESDALFWMVHLNYRLDLPDADVRTILRTWPPESRCSTLLKYDQLRNAMQSHRAFGSFAEAEISHVPTYRFSSGLTTDELGYDMKRRPAWTDRILHLSAGVKVHQLAYAGHPEVTLSDHRPVSAVFEAEVPIFEQREHDAALRHLLRQVADLPADEDTRPTLVVDTSLVDFGVVRYIHCASQVVSVRNSGKVPCAFRFVPLDLGGSISPQWLQVTPLAGFLLPGETAPITFTLIINNKTAAQLNPVRKTLNTALVLHTALGKDHFISIAADYQPTCFANTLSLLTRLPGPIRLLKSEDDLLPENRAHNAPQEVMRLVQALMGVVDIAPILETWPDTSLVNTIQACLDSGDEFPFSHEPGDTQIARAFWDALLLLLGSLKEPIVPYRLQHQCILMTSRDEAFELLGELMPAAINVWISVTAFLQFLCGSSTSPEKMARRISTIYAPVLLPDDPTPNANPISPLAKADFLLYFIAG
ncbi:hypothetical protein HGRIS_012107 [Hohenbuehelia grisea]|uniref:Inositol polyphosphate-related phosphatase domain-containing protein n=1 Tax=Hohenbuehelia grisea TaxID=104357 RepID=A0ABR3IRC0_9AGAR